MNKNYVRGDEGIDWNQYCARKEISEITISRLTDIAAAVKSHRQILTCKQAPAVEPGKRCPPNCNYWERCISGKPDDWVNYLPRLTQTKFYELQATGVESISEIPKEFPLNETQTRIKNVLTDKHPYVSSELHDVLEPLSGPYYYLDFEATNPAMPLYAGNSTYDQLPFQWSLHYVDEQGELGHQEFLAIGDQDPRREFSETLICALNKKTEPIVGYSNSEKSTVEKLAQKFIDLRKPLIHISEQFFDLLKIVRQYIYLEGFQYSYSIKTVGPALVPGFSYDSIGEIKDGLVASVAFQKLSAGGVDSSQADTQLRRDLLDYCRLDTLVMVKVHDALRSLPPTDMQSMKS